MVNRKLKKQIAKAFLTFFLGLISILFLSIWLNPAEAVGRHLEKDYQKKWCAEHGGQTEVVLSDRTRVDCLTDTHAIEFDFAPKWAEAVGQARLYAVKTRKRPGIVLIIEKETEYRFLWRLLESLQGTRKHWAVWVVTPEYLER